MERVFSFFVKERVAQIALKKSLDFYWKPFRGFFLDQAFDQIRNGSNPYSAPF